MDYNKLAELLFPHITGSPADMEAKFPARVLPEGAKVTRIAPSPTGFMHFGTLFPARIAERLAHQSGGVFYLRIEDTDSKREVKGAEKDIIETLAYYQIHFDEGALADEKEFGIYGPYRQSQRAEIYQTFAKQLVREGKAYPCFTTEEELNALHATDKKAEIKNKDWHNNPDTEKEEIKKLRNITYEEAEEQMKKGNPFVLRILSDGDPERKTPFTDLIKGKLEVPENDEDFVLLKSDGIPTYHFAHAIDDHLMGTTHVIRGEEWLPSLAKHIMLFRYLNFRLPKYMHIAQLMKMEGNSKKKLSKRDNGAAVSDYRENGYPPVSVNEYVMTLLNSNFEEWRTANPDKSYLDFPFSIKKMSTSGALFDFDKLNDVSKNAISRMTADTVYDGVTEWAEEYDKDFADLLKADPAYAKSILAIGRGGKKPRKDFAVWKDVKPYMSYFYDGLFEKEAEIPAQFAKEDVKAIFTKFAETYDENDDNNVWFEKIKAISEELGFTSDMKAYKANPENYKGSVGDVSMILRIAVTGRTNSPDMHEIMRILGKERVLSRLNMAEKAL